MQQKAFVPCLNLHLTFFLSGVSAGALYHTSLVISVLQPLPLWNTDVKQMELVLAETKKTLTTGTLMSRVPGLKSHLVHCGKW